MMKFCVVVRINDRPYAAQFEADVKWIPLNARDANIDAVLPDYFYDISMMTDNGGMMFRQTFPKPEDVTEAAHDL